jgi:hypothetical protein
VTPVWELFVSNSEFKSSYWLLRVMAVVAQPELSRACAAMSPIRSPGVGSAGSRCSWVAPAESTRVRILRAGGGPAGGPVGAAAPRG